MKLRAAYPVVLLCSMPLVITACGKSEKKEADRGAATAKSTPAPAESSPTPSYATAAAISEQAAQEAKMVFATRCAACHGATGRGDGPAAAGLNPKPQDYSDPAWQQTVTDEEIARAIVEGGAAVGKSPLMTPNPDLANKPQVVKALVEIVRGFAK